MTQGIASRRRDVLLLWVVALVVSCLSPASFRGQAATATKGPGIVYVNKQYGFRFDLPSSWKGYSILTAKPTAALLEGNSQGPQKQESYVEISIRHPRWTKAGPRQDIPIMVFTHPQWALIQQEKLAVSAAPIPPSELGRNSRYVFALPPRYNYAFSTGFEEVEKILEGKAFHAF